MTDVERAFSLAKILCPILGKAGYTIPVDDFAYAYYHDIGGFKSKVEKLCVLVLDLSEKRLKAGGESR